MNFFVTGTDTDAGKTLISCALLRGFAAQGKRVAGMKPVAAGCNADGQNEDVVQLRAASNVIGGHEVNPYNFEQAVAPHIAAQRAGVSIDLARIVESYSVLAGQADVLVVEGAGGFLVPLNDRQDGGDLARLLGLQVILVVGMRLGCLNHALLTAEAIAARGLALAGWVANRIDRNMAMPDENVAALRQRIAAPLLGVVPHMQEVDARAAAAHLDLDLLRQEQASATGAMNFLNLKRDR